jgi:hypothetical protein
VKLQLEFLLPPGNNIFGGDSLGKGWVLILGFDYA